MGNEPIINDSYQGAATGADHLAQRVAELHAGLRETDPCLLAANTKATYLPAGPGQGTFYLALWGRDVTLTFPEFIARDARTGEMLDTFTQALLAYYFTVSDGVSQSGRWISFSELSEGKFYTQAFHGYTGHELAKTFGNDSEGFAEAAASLDGRRPSLDISLGDSAYEFQVLPHVSLLVACWLGDEDFPPSYRVLFDAAINHHISTDACAVLGGTLTRRLIGSYKRLRSSHDEDRR